MARLTVIVAGALATLVTLPGGAQPRGAAGEPQRSAREAAPVDLTGYWVSLVTEDWIERMSPDSPPSGTGGGFGRRGGGQPAPDLPISNPDEPCRVYGAGGSLRVPGRLHITWLDDDTLGIEMDAGSQRRVFNFDTAISPTDEPSLQGYSVAAWETPEPRRGFRGGPPAAPPAWGSLRVVTTNMTGGYLLSSRSNYTADAVLTEHFTRHSDFGQNYFTVTAVLEDAGGTRITSSTFKKEPNGSKFSPSGCEIVR